MIFIIDLILAIVIVMSRFILKSGFTLIHKHSLISSILNSKSISQIISLHSNFSNSFTPRSYAFSSRIVGRLLFQHQKGDNASLQPYLNDLLKINQSLLSIQESLGIIFLLRCLQKSESSHNLQKFSKFNQNLFIHCGSLLINLGGKFSFYVDYLFQVNHYLKFGTNFKSDQHEQFLKQMILIKKQAYTKINLSYPQSTEQKIDLIYHLLRLFHELIAQNKDILVVHKELIIKLGPDLKQLSSYFELPYLVKSLNIILSELPKIIESGKQLQLLEISIIWCFQQLFSLYISKIQKLQLSLQTLNQLKSNKQIILEKLQNLKTRTEISANLLIRLAISLNKISKIQNSTRVQNL